MMQVAALNFRTTQHSACRLLIFLIFLTALIATTPSVSAIGSEKNQYIETGSILYNRAIERYWEADGSQIGSIGLLDRASRSFAHIADPATRYGLMAQIELYKGRMVLEIKRRSKARPYFRESMRMAELSLSYSENSEALRIRAEAGYDWLYSKRIWRSPRMARDIYAWIQEAVSMDPDNHRAEIAKARIELRMRKRKTEQLVQIRSRLEILEKEANLDKISLFRTRILLAQVNQFLGEKAMRENWCNEARSIYPKNPLTTICH